MVFRPKKRAAKLMAERNSIGNLISLPFCTGGWNTKDPLPTMPAQDAVTLENFIVENDRIVSRGGYIASATGLGTDVQSLFQFANASSTQIISCAGAKIYKGLDPSVTEIGTGFTSARWQGLMMNQYLLLFNGADTPQKYDGTTLSTNVITGISLASSNLVGATNFKNRLIAWENNACGFWYGGSDAISGALTFISDSVDQ